MWSPLPRDWEPRMTALARISSSVNDRPILSSERILHKDYDRKCSIAKQIMIVGFKGLGVKMK
jgi:hypothetical protein